MFKGRYSVQFGKRVLDVRWKRPAYDAMLAGQRESSS